MWSQENSTNRKVLLLDRDRSNPPQDEDSLPTLELSDAEVDALVSTIAPRVQKENERINRELTLLAQRAQVATNGSGAAVALLNTDSLVCRGRSGPAAPTQGTKLDRDAGLPGETVRTGGILLCEDCETDERVDAASCRAEGTRSILIVPLYHNGEVIGIFEVFSREPQAFGYEDIAVLQTMAEMAVNAIYPQAVQRPPAAAERKSGSKAEIIGATPPNAPGPLQDVGIDLSRLIVEPRDRTDREEGEAEPIVQFRTASSKKVQVEELAPFHDPGDDLVCELGPEQVADLLQASEIEPPRSELTLFHPAEEQETRRPAISRKLIIAAAAVVLLALMWLKFCSRAQTTVPQEQSLTAPVVRALAVMITLLR